MSRSSEIATYQPKKHTVLQRASWSEGVKRGLVGQHGLYFTPPSLVSTMDESSKMTSEDLFGHMSSSSDSSSDSKGANPAPSSSVASCGTVYTRDFRVPPSFTASADLFISSSESEDDTPKKRPPSGTVIKKKGTKKERRNKKRNARKHMLRKQAQRKHRDAARALSVNVQFASIMDSKRKYDKKKKKENKKRKRNGEKKEKKEKKDLNKERVFDLEERGARVSNDFLSNHPLNRDWKPTSGRSESTRRADQHWKKRKRRLDNKIVEPITDADGLSLEPFYIDYGDEPDEDNPVGRTIDYRSAVRRFMLMKEQKRARLTKENVWGAGGLRNVPVKLQALAGLRDVSHELATQIPPEMVAYDAQTWLGLRDYSRSLSTFAEKELTKNATTEETKDRIHSMVTDFLAFYHDFVRSRSAMVKAICSAAAQMATRGYNEAMVMTDKGIPVRLPPPPEGIRPLIRSIHTEVYSCSKNDKRVTKRPPGIRGQGPRLSTVILGQQGNKATKKSATRKSTSGAGWNKDPKAAGPANSVTNKTKPSSKGKK